MSECKINAPAVAAWDPCPRCGLGPCHVWRDQKPSVSELVPEAPTPPSGGPIETRPDPAYAAALSEQAMAIDARARAFDLAMRLAAQSDRADEIQFPGLVEISNRIYLYLVSGK